MDSPTAFLRTSILVFLITLALIVTYQLLAGKINTRRLLFAKGRDSAGPSTWRRTSGLSPSRIQLLVVTIGVAIYLLAEVMRDPSRFPAIPTGLLLLMAGSEAIYLARKVNNLIIRRSRSRSRSGNSQT